MPKALNDGIRAVVEDVFEEYMTMNEAAIVFTLLYEEIENKADTDSFTVGELKQKIEAHRATAQGKLANFRKVMDSYKEKSNATRSD